MKTVCFGEIMLRLSPPHYQRFVQAHSFDVTYGGSEANVAVSLAQLGLESYFVTKLPENDLGQAAVNHLRRFGVRTEFVRWGEGRLGVYFLEQGASQRPSSVLYDRAGSSITTLRLENVDWSQVFKEAEWFHWSGITPALGPALRDAVEAACKVAKEQGVTISCDLNYRSKLWGVEEARAAMMPLMDHVDVCMASVGCADTCLNVRDEEATDDDNLDVSKRVARALMETYQFHTVAMTMRQSMSASRHTYRALLLDDTDSSAGYCSSTYEIDLVDRVGAGDAFAAGLIAGLLHEADTRRALDFAVAAAVLKHTIPGDFNLVGRSQIEELARGSGTTRVKR